MVSVKSGKIQDVEGRTLEFKERLDDYLSLQRTVVAFSNDIGGTILVGVRDRDREIIGLTENQVERYLEEIPQSIFDSISPYCRPGIRVLGGSKGQYLEITVYPGTHKPYFIKSLGVPKGVYLRVGSHNKRVSPELLSDLERESKASYFDLEPIDAVSIGQLDSSVMNDFYKSAPTMEQLHADRVVVFNPITQSQMVSTAGLIYFHPEPRCYLPQAELLFAVFSSLDTSAIHKTMDLSSPLPVLASEVLGLMMPYLSSDYKLQGVELKASRFEVPELALREAILNALIHRRYSAPEAIKVAVFPDRVEISNPGNFPGPITDFKSGVSYQRNPHLRNLARKQSLVEKRGLGFRLMFSECEKNRNPEPLIQEIGDAVKVTFRREVLGSSQRQLPEMALALTPLLSSRKDFTISQAAELLEVSKNTARKILYELIDDGLLEQLGRGRSVRYRWR